MTSVSIELKDLRRVYTASGVLAEGEVVMDTGSVEIEIAVDVRRKGGLAAVTIAPGIAVPTEIENAIGRLVMSEYLTLTRQLASTIPWEPVKPRAGDVMGGRWWAA